jgi:DDE family transposase
MAVSVAEALGRIKRNPLSVVDRRTVERVCREVGYRWRDRELDPATTLALFVQQVLHGNTPCTQVRHLAGPEASFSASAYCQARARLPHEVCQALLAKVHEQVVLPLVGRKTNRWHGHRTFHVDGSTFSMPDTPELQEAFGQPGGQKSGCGFPVAHLLVLFSACSGLLLDAFASPLRTGDVNHTPELHLHLDKGDILIGDDSFSGYTHLALLVQAGLHGLFPVHHLRIVDFTPGRRHAPQSHPDSGLPRSRWIKSLGHDDQVVEYFKPRQKPAWISAEQYEALPESIIVRELRRTVGSPSGAKLTLTMVTTLLDPCEYRPPELLELRMRRWDVETNLGHLKTTMGLDVLRCKTEAGVRKELCIFCLVYNLVRVVMLQAASAQQVPVDRISFVDALRWMRHARRGDALPKLVVNPLRSNRIEPRCRKRRPKQYDLMNKPRDVLRKALKMRVRAGLT